MPELNVREATEADIPALLELAEASLGRNSSTRTREFWRWKHFQNPFGVSPCLVAEAEGRIVGMRAFLRWEWAGGGRLWKSVRAVDTATHPDFQGQGLFRRLTLELLSRMREEGVHWVFNTPNRFSRQGYIKMGWRDVGRVPVHLRVNRPFSMAWKLVRNPKACSVDLSGFPKASSILERPALDGLLDAGREEPRLHTPRTRDYLRWRYADVPGHDYRAAWLERGSECAAILFKGKARRGLFELGVSELLAGPSAEALELAARLLKDVLRHSGSDYAVASAAPDSLQAAILGRAGFLGLSRIGPRFTVRRLREALPLDPEQPASWAWSLGDLEIF